MACTWTRRREWIVLAVAVLIVLVVAVAVEGSARSGEYAQREFLLGELLPRTVSNMPQTVPQTVQQTVPQTVPQTAESSPPPPAESSDCGIFFNLDTDVFTLQTRRTSYVMHVRAEDRLLEHVYWGERLHREDDVRYLLANNEIVSFDAGIKNALLLEYAGKCWRVVRAARCCCSRAYN